MVNPPNIKAKMKSKGLKSEIDKKECKKYRDTIKAMFDRAMKTELERRKIAKRCNAADDPSKKMSFRCSEEERKVEISQGIKRQLSEETLAEVKRRKKEKDLSKKGWPRIFAKEEGKASSLSVESGRVPLYMGDVQGLLLYSVLANKSPVQPRWASVKNLKKISQVVVVLIEGVGLCDIQRNTNLPSEGRTASAAGTSKTVAVNHSEGNSTMDKKETLGNGSAVDTGNIDNVSSSGGLPDCLKNTLPKISHHMQHSLEIVAPSRHGFCPVEELLQLKSVKKACSAFDNLLQELDEFAVENKILKPTASFFKFLSSVLPNPGDKLHPNDKFSRVNLLLTPAELVKNRYPLPLPGFKGSTNRDFVLTADCYKKVTSHSPMFGLDCEMCMTTIKKLELTSISVVNEKLEVVYHSLVLPHNPVVNFLTRYSGITKEMLANVTKRLADVQRDLRNLLPPDAILVGHSLDSDLTALKMMHPYVIDSSIVYNLSGIVGQKTRLKVLSDIFLNEVIQARGDKGHDPTEDASASLKLVQHKLKHDEAYGNVILGWEGPNASLDSWHEVQPDVQKPEKNSKMDTEEQPLKQEDKTLSEDAIGPFTRHDINIFQKLENRSLAIVTTALCINNYMAVLASLDTMPVVEVVSGNKQVSKLVKECVANTNLTFVHIEMGRKLSQCPNEATRRRQLTKLDKRLKRIHDATAPKSVHVYVFSGSSQKVHSNRHSNGFVLVGIKDLPFNT